MSHSTHTPGPWVFSFESADPEWAVVTTSGGTLVANVNADHKQESNARLIAAAPDMLEALEALQHADKCFCDAGFAGPDHHPRHSEECEKARAAIDKAKGEWP